ncbi:MAG: FtsK/SpoIIIE domain-containing protein [Pseudomonadota bacterium]
MTIQLSVADVRSALMRASGPNSAGSGEPATLLLGRLFHEVFADLLSTDPVRSGLKIVAESGADPQRRRDQLLDHSWQRLLAPRLRRNAAVLQNSSAQVLTLWNATRNLTDWLAEVVNELIEHRPRLRGAWEELEKVLQAEVPLKCELLEPGWSEPVTLIGFADSVLRVPGRDSFCAVELKLGRATPVVDLGQAALYHLILTRSTAASARSALALMRFSPDLEEHLVESEALTPAIQRLLDLIGRLAGVIDDRAPQPTPTESGKGQPLAVQAKVEAKPNPTLASPKASAAQPDEPPPPSPYVELGKRLARAYREHGIGVEVRSEPGVGPRFLRFDVRLTPGMKLDGVKKRTREVQHRLELAAEPMVVQEAGRLYIDLERPDPETVLFSSIASELPAVDTLYGSAKLLVGVDAARQLRFADLASSGRSHVLAAGMTSSGKSEWLRMMLASLIASNTPETLRIVTLDPKLAAFNDLEHSKFLWKKNAFWILGSDRPASEVFQDLIEEMDRRYQLTRQSGADNLRSHIEKTGKPLPRIICVCDEYFALVSQSKQEKSQIEGAVSLLGAKGRAAGIHLVLATQQPSRAIISGAIQSNLPCRVALALGSPIESNMILGTSGAERLTGSGDLLYKDFGDPVRLQAPFLTESERLRWFTG